MFLEDDSVFLRRKTFVEEELEDKIESAQDYLQSVIEKLYAKEDLDLLDLENSLDELCHALGVNLIPGDLQIQRKKAI